jgi:hypothetical protein
LIGKGAGKFDGATNPYSAFVFRKGTGTGGAPQGEVQLILAFNTNTGNVTAAAFTVPIAVGDEVIVVHPSIAGILAAGGALAQITRLAGAATAGIHVHADDLLMQQVFEFNPLAVRRKVHSIWMDFVNFAAALQTVTYQLSYQVDGVNYRIFDTNAAGPWTIAMNDGVLIAVNSAIDHPFRLEIQKSVAEGAPRNVPFEVIYEDMS